MTDPIRRILTSLIAAFALAFAAPALADWFEDDEYGYYGAYDAGYDQDYDDDWFYDYYEFGEDDDYERFDYDTYDDYDSDTDMFDWEEDGLF